MPKETQTLDLAAVERYLTAHLPGFSGPITAEKFQVGQSNPTFLLTTAAGKYVLRRKPPGVLLKSAHAVDREFRVQRALAGTDVPVAPVHLLCQDPSVIGSDFYVMNHVAGRNFNEPTLDGLTVSERRALMDDWNRVLAALHNVDIDAVGLGDFGPPGNYFERQIARWTKQYAASETSHLPDMDALTAAMARHLPPDDGQRTLVHGDYRIDNMMFAQAGTDCVAVLDWELSTTGHPYADLAAVLMQWQMPTGPDTRGLEGVDRAALGLPTDADFVAAYCARRGIDGIAHLGFYVAFCFFRMAAILQGVYRRSLDGNASNPEAGRRAGQMVPMFAAKGMAALDG
ncbi:Predicted kinase, aminoglycoside phosphotransferase (APT) family [Loktanella sp. DSM 29012]|uniref:phosphotransferase family protein n=1 Tax=Loktanella sp. DSM 29012 TaxID=1881056 RepID=UPI0008CACD72|nr:phosphotransferase family protein [Loktanella sp. DSM 29012]SEQ52889.1 Predicted kinase, aminoglycoside phosphotransferase (APT) family [Loktanella sp. DSM 29012]